MKKFVTFLVALTATMAMGVTAHAATYGLEAAKAVDGSVNVPVSVTTAVNETTTVNGYIIKFTYDSNKVTPKQAADDVTGNPCYATADETFGEGVIVSDIIQGSDGMNTLVVAWAGPKAVQVGSSTQVVKEQLATVAFDVKETTSTEPIPLQVTAATVAKDATSTPDNLGTADIVSGEIDLATVLYGDVNGNGYIDTGDASQIDQHIAEVITLTPQQIIIADVNGNGYVDTGDASQIDQYVAEAITSFPVEKAPN